MAAVSSRLLYLSASCDQSANSRYLWCGEQIEMRAAASYKFVMGIIDGDREATEFDAKAAIKAIKKRFDVLI
ncbi:hypothetical protein BELL_0073g00190 [Botrytis elliptica]|uniref:Uncharacterized protein n=1 Tax=Botrytis elliptica TaxID=278938 RepID=A0A4Z1JWF7_9HELO|nr:hypothetical protein BELL_0073g00190 [Botrytis elliptica]